MFIQGYVLHGRHIRHYFSPALEAKLQGRQHKSTTTVSAQHSSDTGAGKTVFRKRAHVGLMTDHALRERTDWLAAGPAGLPG